MTIKQKLGIILIALSIAAGLGIWLIQKPAHAPDALFKTIHGETLSLAELKGKPVLITFWASDCPSCLREIPELISLHQEFQAIGLTIIAVAMYYDPPNHVVELVREKSIPYAVALDPYAEHAKRFGDVQFTPTSFLVNRNGMIVMQKTGELDIPALQRSLRENS